MKQNEFITIVIPTYNRTGYLKRLLGYYNDCRLTYNIIVADGSSDEIKKANREMVSSFPVLRVLHLDGYSPETRLNVRISDALNYVNTKYSVICADDDFITPKGMAQSVDFLESHPDFSVAHGQYIFFNLEDEEKKESKFRWKTIYSNESITSTDPAIRLHKQLSEYSIATFYAVHKTEFLQWIWTETPRYTKDTDALFIELLASTLTLVYGKMKCLDVLYAVRDLSSTRVGYIQTFRDYMEACTYKEQYVRFRECLSAHLSKQSQLSLRKAKKVVDKAMTAYMKKRYPAKKRVILAPLTIAAGHIMDRPNFPGWLRKGIRSSNTRLRSYLRLTRTEPVEEDAFDLPLSLRNDEDIERIKRQVLSSAQPSAT